MARPLSDDLRRRLVQAVSNGMSRRSVARLLGLSPSCVIKLMQRFEETGSTAAKPMGGHRPYVLEDERDWLLARIAEKPDITLRALAAELASRGIEVSHYAVWHLLAREGITFKKKPQRGRAGSSRREAPARALAAASGKVRS